MRSVCASPSKNRLFLPHVAEVLGIEVNTISLIARLTPGKVSRALDQISLLLHRQTATKKELQSIAGLLSFALRVIPAGKPFLWRVWSLFASLSDLGCRPRRQIPREALRDLEWWRLIIPWWNGLSLEPPCERRQIHIWTDASGSLGAGGWSGERGFAISFPRRHMKKDIMWKEAWAILHAIEVFSGLDSPLMSVVQENPPSWVLHPWRNCEGCLPLR